jgi:hypothetical protein
VGRPYENNIERVGLLVGLGGGRWVLGICVKR